MGIAFHYYRHCISLTLTHDCGGSCCAWRTVLSEGGGVGGSSSPLSSVVVQDRLRKLRGGSGDSQLKRERQRAILHQWHHRYTGLRGNV